MNPSSVFATNAGNYTTLKYAQLVDAYSRHMPSRRSRITEDSGMQNYYSTSNVMNYKGNSLDATDIEGAIAGSGADGIFRFRKTPLNPLMPAYAYPGDTELKGIPSRRHQ